jgi:multiple sugar transport system substrate-binding protein
MLGGPGTWEIVHHERRGGGLGRALRMIGSLVAVGALIAAGWWAYGSSTDKADGKTVISIFWWGGSARASITDQVLALYTKKHPNVAFAKQWQGNSGYYDKLATMATGGTAPDMFQIDDNELTDYTSRGLLLDLGSYVGHQINLNTFPAALRRAGTVGSQVSGIVAAENTPAMVYDKTALQKLGLPLPSIGMSWQQLIDLGQQTNRESGGRLAGVMNPSADYKAFQVWLRQRGKDLYSGNSLGFTQDDLAQWFQFWADAMAKTAVPSADVVHAADAGDVTKQLVVTGQAVTSFMWSNQLEEMQKGTSDQLALVTYPGDPTGQWLRASMYWSGYRGTRHPAIVADVINFMVNDSDAAAILGAERGLFPNLDLRTATASRLTAPMQASVAFETGNAGRFGKTPTPPPAGHSRLRAQLVSSAESVDYGKQSPQLAAAAFFQQMTSIIHS